MYILKAISLEKQTIKWLTGIFLSTLFVTQLFTIGYAAEMENVHALLKTAHSEMQEINTSVDIEKRAHLIKAHQITMKTLSKEFSELQAEGKLSGNSTLMADLMLYEMKMLEAMMREIEKP